MNCLSAETPYSLNSNALFRILKSVSNLLLLANSAANPAIYLAKERRLWEALVGLYTSSTPSTAQEQEDAAV